MLDSEIGHDQRRRSLIKARHPGRIWRLESHWHARGLSSRATQMLRNGWLDAHVPPDPMFSGSGTLFSSPHRRALLGERARPFLEILGTNDLLDCVQAIVELEGLMLGDHFSVTQELFDRREK